MVYQGRIIKNNLRRYRKISGFTQKDVARILEHKSTNRISQWEVGHAVPSLENLIKLRILYNILIEELYSDKIKNIRQNIEPIIKEYAQKTSQKISPKV